jgi:hypothetical protein
MACFDRFVVVSKNDPVNWSGGGLIQRSKRYIVFEVYHDTMEFDDANMAILMRNVNCSDQRVQKQAELDLIPMTSAKLCRGTDSLPRAEAGETSGISNPVIGVLSRSSA